MKYWHLSITALILSLIPLAACVAPMLPEGCFEDERYNPVAECG